MTIKCPRKSDLLLLEIEIENFLSESEKQKLNNWLCDRDYESIYDLSPEDFDLIKTRLFCKAESLSFDLGSMVDMACNLEILRRKDDIPFDFIKKITGFDDGELRAFIQLPKEVLIELAYYNGWKRMQNEWQKENENATTD